MKTPLFLILLLACGQGLYAQQPNGTPPLSHHPRPEDHMSRSRVLTRLDLMDKLNQPLATVRAQTDTQVYTQPRYSQVQGLTRTLLQVWLTAPQSGEPFPGYHPSRLEQPISRAEVRTTLWERSPEYQLEVFKDIQRSENPSLAEDPDSLNTHEMPEEDPYAYDYNYDLVLDDPDTDVLTDPASAGATKVAPDFAPGMLTGTDVIVELVEDRIFDKNKGTEHFIPRYLILRSVNAQAEGKKTLVW
ncbi:MAG: hypothetical protein KF690_00265 [Bacteroidetes bacterium]|nr:hypothetical protein [Bacteroidota bacterium]